MASAERFRVRIADREHRVTVGDDGRVAVDGVDYTVVRRGARAVLVRSGETLVHDSIELDDARAPTRASLGGVQIAFVLRTEREAALDEVLRGGTAVVGAGQLQAPMPGRVVRVLTAIGDEVEQGAPIVIVEAMKMENELQAPRGGTIEAIHVSEGDTVDAGQALIDIRPPD